MIEYTKGPWKVITEAAALEVEVFEIAEVSHFRVIPDRSDTWSSQGDAFADARLIAAAPDLLDVLQEIVDRGLSMTRIDKARAAIAKATGGQP